MRRWPGSGSMCRRRSATRSPAATPLLEDDAGAAAAAGRARVVAEPAHVVKLSRRAERWSRIILTIAEAARLIEKKRAVAGRAGRQPARPHRAARRAAQQLHPRAGRRGAPRRPRRRGRDRRRPLSRAAARHPDRPQGHLRDRRGRDDRPFQGHAGPCADGRRLRRRPGCARPARSSWASSRRTNSPSAARASTCRGRRRATRGTRPASPAARRAAPAPRSRPGWCSAAPAATPAARSAAPPPIAASPASSRPTA